MKSTKVWLVTGASSGIGRSFVELLIRKVGVDPIDIICVGRSSLKLEQLRSISNDCGRLRLLPLDLSNYDSNYYHLKKTLNGDKLKYVVSCAGICGKPAPFRERDFSSVIYETQTNIAGTLSIVHSALKLWNDEENGHIIIVSSPIGRVPIPNYAVYASTKASLISFSECLSEELRENTDICVSCVLPTLTSTPMLESTEKPSRFIYPIEASYVASQMFNLIESKHYGIKSIGLQAAAATAMQRVTPFINKLFI